MTLGELFSGIANAIRSKDGTTASIPATTFPERILAISGSGGGGGDGSPYVVNIPVNISASVSVTAEKYYRYMLFNGVRLPRIPDSVRSSYAYIWIRKNNTTGYYDLVCSNLQPWYDASGPGVRYGTSTGQCTYYQVPIATSDSATEWTLNSTLTTWFGLGSDRTILWSDCDIPNGSATATDIYFEGTEPVPTD